MKNIKILLVLLLSLLVFNTISNSADALEEKKTIRVGISNQNFSSREHEKIKISSQDIIKIIDLVQNTRFDDVKAGDKVEIVMNGITFDIYINDKKKYENLSGPLLLSSNKPLEVIELNRKGTPAKYEGMFEIKASKKKRIF